MEKKDANYELMKVTEEEVSSRYPNGIDEVSVAVGGAKEVIRWLLKNSEGLEGLALTKKPKCCKCHKKLAVKDNYIKYRGKILCGDCAHENMLVNWF